MACSIILFETHFNWHLARSPGHNRICYDTNCTTLLQQCFTFLSDSKGNSSLNKSLIQLQCMLTHLRERMTVSTHLLSSANILTKYSSTDISTFLIHHNSHRQCHIVAAAQNGPLAKCSIVILIQFCTFFHFFLCVALFSTRFHCAEHFSGTRLEQAFYFRVKIGWDCTLQEMTS